MEGQEYVLNSVIEHSGISRHSGHYVAYVKYNGLTYRIDDSVVSIDMYPKVPFCTKQTPESFIDKSYIEVANFLKMPSY